MTKRHRKPHGPGFHTCVCKREIHPETTFAKACVIVAQAFYCEDCLASPAVLKPVSSIMSLKLAEKLMIAIAKVVESEVKT